MKRLLFGLVIGLLIGTAGTAMAANTDLIQAVFAKYNLKIDNQNVVEIEPLVFENTTYLPVRETANLLGYDVTWHAETRTIELTADEMPAQEPAQNDKDVSDMDTQTIIKASISDTVEFDGAKIKINSLEYHDKVFKDHGAASKHVLAVLDLDIWFQSDEYNDERYKPHLTRSYIKEWSLDSGNVLTIGYPTSDSVNIIAGQWNNATITLQIREDELVETITLVNPYNRNQLAILNVTD